MVSNCSIPSTLFLSLFFPSSFHTGRPLFGITFHFIPFCWLSFSVAATILTSNLKIILCCSIGLPKCVAWMYYLYTVCTVLVRNWLFIVQVFAQTGLVSFIEHGESLLLNEDAGPQMSPGTRGSPKAAVSSIKAILVNCDGPMFQYTPIFDQNVLQLVSKPYTILFPWILTALEVFLHWLSGSSWMK